MKFIKNPDLNPKSVTDNSVTVNADKQVIFGTTESITVPKGTEAERPASPVTGMIRYNTDDNEFEMYQEVNGSSAWREVRFKEPTTISVERFGPGDFVTTDFGPLDSGDPDFPLYTDPAQVLVFVGNVIQIPNINYIITTGGGSSYVQFTDEVPPLDEYVTVIHGLGR